MTPHIPDEFSTSLIDGSPFMIAEMMQRADLAANDPSEHWARAMASMTDPLTARRRELLNQVRLFFRSTSPGGSNSTAHLPGLFCCYAKLISQKFGLQLHHFVYVLGIH